MKNKEIALISIGVACVASSFLLFSYLKGRRRTCRCKNRVKNKVVAITGANCGIGFETALSLASSGATVYLLCRDRNKGEKSVEIIRDKNRNPRVSLLQVDLCNIESINECITRLFLGENKLDILILNAAIFHNEPQLTADGYEIHFQTNFIGPVILAERLFPLLLESTNPKVIFLNSDAHKLATIADIQNSEVLKSLPAVKSFNDHVLVYARTKLALKIYADYLAEINRNLPFLVISVNPGNVWTNIYRYCWRSFADLPQRLRCLLFMSDTKAGAQSVIHASNAHRLTTGSYISDLEEVPTHINVNEVQSRKRFIENILRDLKLD